MEVTSLYREPETNSEVVSWPALECVDVFKLYRSGLAETMALRGLDVRVDAGEFVAVLGPSGSGKSTFLRLAAGLERASAGEVRAFGHSLVRMNESDLAKHRARTVAVVLQSNNLWTHLTARQNVVISLEIAGMRDALHRADAALAAFGLERRSRHRPSSLSGGEQQRVAIAAAAAREAPLVLADEPTGELDSANQKVVLDALSHLCREHGVTVVTVTHSRAVADTADRVVTFLDGRVSRI